MEIREYVDLQDMISQAKFVEAGCITESDDNFETGLTRGMIQRTNIQLFLLGIHETNKQGKAEILANDANDAPHKDTL